METKFDWRQHSENRDFKRIDKNIEELQQLLHDMRRDVTNIQRQYDVLNDEKWKDTELTTMKFQLNQALREKNNGFPLTVNDIIRVNKWQAEHDTNIHNNPEQYHGASGGGFTWVFYPSGLGTPCDCICSSCQAKAIQEAGTKWYDHCKKFGGIFEVRGFD